MNTNKLFPFMGMSEVPSSDLNSIQTPGMYYLAEASKYTNAPGFGWCSFIVFKTLYVTQIAFQSTGNQTMSRVFDGNVWSAWQHLDNFGYNSLAELASGVANSKTVVKAHTFTTGTTNVIQMNYGFAVIVLNSATVYISVSQDRTFRTNIVGTLNANISSIGYDDGYVTITVTDNVQFGIVVYAPHGTILI